MSKRFPSQIAVCTNGAQEDQVNYLLDGGTFMDEFFSVNLPFLLPDADSPSPCSRDRTSPKRPSDRIAAWFSGILTARARAATRLPVSIS